MTIKEIANNDEKSSACESILSALPEWFGNEAAIVEYTQKVRSMPFFLALEDDNPIGFIAIQRQNEFTAELCVMGVIKKFHRHGVGRLLVNSAELFCREQNYKYLTVKTLDVSADYEPYDRTRNFYRKMGFIPLEVFPLFWDKDNPCLFLVQHLS